MQMLILHLILFAALFLPQDLHAMLEIEGNHQLSTRSIQRILPQEPARSMLRIQEDLDSLRLHYASLALPFASFELLEVDSLPGGFRPRKVSVMEGPLLVMGSLHLDAPEGDWPEFRELKPGKVLKAGVLREGLLEWLLLLEKQGRPLARLELHDFQLLPDKDEERWRLELWMSLEDAGLIKPERLLTASTLRTRKRTLQTLARLDLGEAYDPDRVRRAHNRLLATGWFQELTGPGLCRTPDGLAYLLEAKERSFYRIDGMLGWLPGLDGEAGRLAYHAELDLDNLAGSGRSLRLLASRPDGESQDLALRYREGFLFGLPLGAGFSIEQTQRDSSWVELKASIQVDAEPWIGVNLSAMLGAGELNPDSLNGYLLRGIDRSTLREMQFEAKVDRRGDPRNPRRGWLAGLRESSLTRTYSAFRGLPARQSSLDLQKHEVWTQLFLPIRSALVFAPAARGGLLDGGEAGAEDRFLLGGLAGPRGSIEHSIQTSEFILLQAELRYLLGPASRLALFWDHLRWLPPGAESVTASNGRGFAFTLPVREGQLDLSYALQPGDALGSGTLHVRMIRRF